MGRLLNFRHSRATACFLSSFDTKDRFFLAREEDFVIVSLGILIFVGQKRISEEVVEHSHRPLALNFGGVLSHGLVARGGVILHVAS